MNSMLGNEKIQQLGKVEMVLIDINDSINRVNKTVESIIDLIQSPQPCDSCGVPCCEEVDPTLVQRLAKTNIRILSTAEKLDLIHDILMQNLGSIKLD